MPEFRCGHDEHHRWIILNAVPYKMLLFRYREVFDGWMFNPPHEILKRLEGPTVELELHELQLLADLHEQLEAKRATDVGSYENWGKPNTRRVEVICM